MRREVAPTTPVRVEYRLTAMGEALRPIMDDLGAWARAWVEDEEQPTATATPD